MLDEPTPGVALRIYGAASLRRRCREVAAGEDVSALAAAMLALMERAGGVGLAAPQVGDLRRLIVVSEPDRRRSRPIVMVNPVIEERFGPAVPFEEGCLSFPDLYLTLRRPRGVVVRYRDAGGAARTLREDSLLARVIQHEVDHLDGILFIDHLTRWRRWLLAGRLLRLRASGRMPLGAREARA
ncbi:MAG TPA: peptide deformylase [Candidatus Krumholzibacteria bacterium]|nr:peptide deformylase [Candidatus Krumholzibacteria bacterium]HPD71376.1 peptide deformylase [Candidatus Krumholzibacteria bacterium]HRY38924.1 peptide deformylase [Candidatus Krumholzibacteria bacterium]